MIIYYLEFPFCCRTSVYYNHDNSVVALPVSFTERFSPELKLGGTVLDNSTHRVHTGEQKRRKEKL